MMSSRYRKKQKRIQKICKMIIAVCMLFIFASVGYAIFYTVYKPVVPKSEVEKDLTFDFTKFMFVKYFIFRYALVQERNKYKLI